MKIREKSIILELNVLAQGHDEIFLHTKGKFKFVVGNRNVITEKLFSALGTRKFSLAIKIKLTLSRVVGNDAFIPSQ